MYVHCSESTTQVVALGSALLYVSSPSHRARGVHLKSLYEYHQFKKVNLSQYTRNSVSHATLWRASGCCTAGERHHQAHLRIRGRAGCRAAARRPAAVGRLPHLRHELPAGRRRQHRHQRAQAGGHCISYTARDPQCNAYLSHVGPHSALLVSRALDGAAGGNFATHFLHRWMRRSSTTRRHRATRRCGNGRRRTWKRCTACRRRTMSSSRQAQITPWT